MYDLWHNASAFDSISEGCVFDSGRVDFKKVDYNDEPIHRPPWAITIDRIHHATGSFFASHARFKSTTMIVLSVNLLGLKNMLDVG